MSSEPTSLVEHFALLKDPRMLSKNEHNLLDVVVIATCGIICGADDWVSIAEFGRSKESWFRTFLELPTELPHMTRLGGSSRLSHRQRFSTALRSGCAH